MNQRIEIPERRAEVQLAGDPVSHETDAVKYEAQLTASTITDLKKVACESSMSGIWAAALYDALKGPFSKDPIFRLTAIMDINSVVELMHYLQATHGYGDDRALDAGLGHLLGRASVEEMAGMEKMDLSSSLQLALVRAWFLHELGLREPDVALRTAVVFLATTDGMDRDGFLRAGRNWTKTWATDEVWDNLAKVRPTAY
jgi:hypothetical protein